MTDPSGDHNKTFRTGKLAEAAAIHGPKLIYQLDLDPADRQVKLAVADLCTEMFAAGVRTGAALLAAQAIERGLDIRLELIEDEGDAG